MSSASTPDSASVVLPDGRRLAYRSFGAPDGWPVVYCHGGLSAPTDIAFADSRAAARHVRIVAVARPGIGDSDRHVSRRVVDWAGDVHALADALGLDVFAALGWSAGGPFALALAAELGPRVRRTATVGGMAPLVPPNRARQLGLAVDRILFPLSARAPWLAAALVGASVRLPASALRRQLLRAVRSEGDHNVVAAMTPEELTRDLRVATAHGPRGLVDDYVVLGRPWGFSPAEVAGPVTVFQGEEDRLLPRAHAEALAAGLPAGHLQLVPGAGHFLLHTHLDAVLDALGA